MMCRGSLLALKATLLSQYCYGNDDCRAFREQTTLLKDFGKLIRISVPSCLLKSILYCVYFYSPDRAGGISAIIFASSAPDNDTRLSRGERVARAPLNLQRSPSPQKRLHITSNSQHNKQCSLHIGSQDSDRSDFIFASA